MALAHAIAEHLPYLRRYARALCGTQKSGDAYVRACLEAIVADPSVIDAATRRRGWLCIGCSTSCGAAPTSTCARWRARKPQTAAASRRRSAS